MDNSGFFVRYISIHSYTLSIFPILSPSCFQPDIIFQGLQGWFFKYNVTAYNLATPIYAAQILSKETAMDIQFKAWRALAAQRAAHTKPLPTPMSLKKHQRLKEPLFYVSNPKADTLCLYVCMYVCIMYAYIYIYMYVFKAYFFIFIYIY